MNKDEMIKDIQRTLEMAMCDELPFIDTCEMGATSLYNANCRILAEDEIVIKKSEQKQWLKDCIESNKKTEEIAQKQTAREILKEIKQKYGRSCSEYYPEYIEFTSWELNKIAKKYGVELED